MCLKVGGEVKHGTGEDLFLEQEHRHDQAAEPVVAIQKGMQNLELPMDYCQLHERVRAASSAPVLHLSMPGDD